VKVLKFGGTSVGSADRILQTIECVRATPDCGAVVVSALSGVTDELMRLGALASAGDSGFSLILSELQNRHFKAIEQLIAPATRGRTLAWVKSTLNELEEAVHGVFVLRECSPKTSDYILSFGERLSAFIIAAACVDKGFPAEYVDAREMILTDDHFGNAEFYPEASAERICARIKASQGLPIVTGFIAATLDGRTTTLGRGGSDLTVSIIGAALAVEEIEIWTDVDGIMTADPRLVPTAFPIDHLTYEEAMELSHFGAKIIYPPTIQPALKKGIPIRIKNTMNPSFPGSVIGGSQKTERLVTGISSISQVAFLRVQGLGMQGVAGTSKRVFTALADHAISVILITQASSEHTICFSVMPDKAEEARKAIDQEFEHEIARQLLEPVVVEKDLSILSVVGEQMRHMPGLGGRVFTALGANGINVVAIAQGSSELNISVVISAQDRKKALNAVHDALFLSDLRTAHIFLVGDGLIGTTLLKQLAESRESLTSRYHLNLQVTGITNTRFMALSEAGISALKATEAAEKEPASIDEFVNIMLGFNLPHSIFVDCTASEALPQRYGKILDANISVVTPNKRALTGSLKGYSDLKTVERRRNVHFLYETCVGAGLPIIGTLNDLVKSGDEIFSVEAVLSGTLSYLFNNYRAGVSFAETVKRAQELGYTEPDPRDDLSGRDVGRKLLILAREIGYQLEENEVSVEDLVPAPAAAAKTVPEFYERLQEQENIFSAKLSEANESGGKLVYLASVSKGRAEAKLSIIGADHPFYGLSGSDNIVAFTTKRYSTRPLVVKGPGAGPEVTAAGVLADIIRVVQ
jgi:aspartokinase/homoserine dehydrogenase 1